jgi:pilus assembly protein CpaB
MFTFGLIFANKAGSGAQITVVVAAEPIPARTSITPDMLKTVQMPATSALPGVYTSISAVSDQYAVVDIPKAQAITPNMVARSISDLPANTVQPVLPIPQGYIVVTIPDAEQQGVAGFVGQGDYVDIIVTVDKSSILQGVKGSVSSTVFAAVYVVRVGPQTNVPKQGQAQGVASSLTVEMSQCDATYMAWFIQNAQSIKYTLISKKDYPLSQPTAPPSDCAYASTSVPGKGGIVGPVAIETRYHFLEG